MDGCAEIDQVRGEKAIAGVTAVVLGMHRSGTSCLVQILRACGMHFGDADQAPAADNMQGFGESPEVVAINDLILARSGGAWDRVPAKLRLDPEILQRMKDFVAGLRRACFIFIARSENPPEHALRFPGVEDNTLEARVRRHSVWGWKDPRTVLTFPLWKPLIIPYRVVACFRHPAGVAKSLAVRNGMTMEQGYALWAAYTERLLEHVRDEPRVLWFDFDRTPEHLDSWLEDACHELGLVPTPAAAAAFNKFQRHHNLEKLPRDPRLSGLYQELVTRARQANDSTACRPPLSAQVPAVERPADAAVDSLRRDLAALADVESKHNEFLQGHARELREAGELGSRLDARTEWALARIDQLERSLAELREKLTECDCRLRSILDSRAWRSYQWLRRTRLRLRKLNAAVMKPLLGLARRVRRFAAWAAAYVFG
jgi:hypothetical protein